MSSTKTASHNLQRLWRQGWRGKLKVAAYCLLPAFTVLCVAETAVRLSGNDVPLAGTIFFQNLGRKDSLHRADLDLFFSMKPNFRGNWQGAAVTTNHLGLRSAEIGPKRPKEFRILSLGESSTFGAGVGDDETYSAQLETLLNEQAHDRFYRVINAGVSGYTSFQSVKYLETRGLRLDVDLVLFYHEINDAQLSEYSDKELYQSRAQAWHRQLAHWSALYRWMSNAQARRKIAAIRAENRLLEMNGVRPSSQQPRVAPDDRWKNLERLRDLCRQNQVGLVILHPAYAGSKPHSCELTEFCRATGTTMFESFAALHPVDEEPGTLFLDECHPNQKGHQSLAQALSRFLKETSRLN